MEIPDVETVMQGAGECDPAEEGRGEEGEGGEGCSGGLEAADEERCEDDV